MHRDLAGQGYIFGLTGPANDVCMCQHGTIMHPASQLRKCHLHHGWDYDAMMQTPADRLKAARIAAGYETALDASEAMGIPSATYNQAERSTRALTEARAQRYAKFFRTTPEWLLYGRGRSGAEPSVAELEAMIRQVLAEVLTLDVKIADLPNIVAPSLHRQLQLHRDGAVPQLTDGRQALLSDGRSRPATN